MRAIGLGLVALFATVAASLAQPTYPPGSRIGLTPPQDMTASKRFSGFENAAKGASISVMEMPADAYAQLAGGLTREALARQGITVMARQELKLGGKPAILISADQTAGSTKLRKWVLALSDPGTTAFVVAQCLSEGGYSEEEMQASLKSVALRAPLSLDEQLAALPFKLGTTAGLRPVRSVSGNALVLTDGPLDVVKEAEQPVLVVASSFMPSPPPGEARERFARAALASNQSVRDIAIERSGPFRQKGQDWHEIVATGTDAASGHPVVVLQTIRFGQSRYLRMVGLTRKDTRDRDLPRFRSVIDGVEADDGALR
ncbi:MAG TPA: hypothetical protein VHK66_05995 [Microvirga sp.]|jgi:hypothetical protein|nr:hypothetical protein [Microvirga sp.]